jgi:hypothetical protein
MTNPAVPRFIVPLLGIALALLAAAPARAADGPCPGLELAPDLVSAVPSQVNVNRVDDASGKTYVLEFRSGMTNVGRGELRLVGSRPDAGSAMRARQVVSCAGQIKRSNGSAGPMRYVRQPTHQHWHLMDVERYRLMSLEGDELSRASKRGFCLGDSIDPKRAIAGKPAGPVFNWDRSSACAARRPRALRLVEGLSVGYADAYSPFVEGQYLPVTGLAAGQYRVLNELDPGDRLLELTRANNVAGVDVDLWWPNGPDEAPRFKLLGTCRGSAACASAAPSVSPPADASAFGPLVSAAAAIRR